MAHSIIDIKKHFKNLGYKISITQLKHKHRLNWQSGLNAVRLCMLATYYFGDNTRIRGYGVCTVKLSDFKREGHKEITGICKSCGCTQDDGCYDEETGSCWWVREDLCSACATPEEKKQAANEMRTLMNSS